jgi:hypothetical protein
MTALENVEVPLELAGDPDAAIRAAQELTSVFDPAFATAGVDQNPALYRIHKEATVALQETARRHGLPADQKGLARALLDAFIELP